MQKGMGEDAVPLFFVSVHYIRAKDIFGKKIPVTEADDRSNAGDGYDDICYHDVIMKFKGTFFDVY